ncbi:ATP-binding protein [Serratia fonticola]|uniref:ATP-binding protein n=1 Tax=Serratia fonticola TaxID=47917 RepID=UPI0034C63E4D
MNTVKQVIPAAAINLVGFSLLEPCTPMQRFFPSWYNVWEAWLYKKANAKAGSDQWLFRRFGIDSEMLPEEALRKANYRGWLNDMSAACAQAVAQLGSKGEFRLRNERNALIYCDSWGEASVFEGVNSWRDSLSVDILPKGIVRDYGIKDFTCKLRGERNGLVSALRMAQDCLNSNMADNVIICGQFRSFPALVFSEAEHFPSSSKRGPIPANSQFSVERVGCLILKKQPGQGVALHLSDYQALSGSTQRRALQLADHCKRYLATDTQAVLGVTPPALSFRAVQRQAFEQLPAGLACVSLSELYGDSGCMNPALAWQYLLQSNITGHSLLNVLDGEGGAWLLENWVPQACHLPSNQRGTS